jgi:hypothetical protein
MGDLPTEWSPDTVLTALCEAWSFPVGPAGAPENGREACESFGGGRGHEGKWLTGWASGAGEQISGALVDHSRFSPDRSRAPSRRPSSA